MPLFNRRVFWHAAAFTVAICAIALPAAAAKDAGPAKAAEQHAADEDPKAALIALKNTIRKSPQDPALHVKIAKLYFRLGDLGSAQREAEAARDLKAAEADYLPVLLDTLLMRKRFKDLLDTIEPGDRTPVLESRVRTALGIAAIGLHYDAKAEALLTDAVGLDQSASEPAIQLAWFLNGTRSVEADRVIDQAIAANPQSAELRRVKGEMLRARGNAEAAVRLFDEALAIDPNLQLARLSRARANIARGEFAAADRDLDPILQAAPNHLLANYLRAVEQIKQARYAAADQTLDRIAAAFPTYPAGYFLRGATKFGLGKWEAAEVILGKYLNRVPDDPEAVRLTASAALQQHGAARAIDYLKPLVDKFPPDARTLTLLGNAYLADGKPELALQQFRKAALMDPDDAALKTRVAAAEIGAGQAQQGLERLAGVFGEEAGAGVAGPTLLLAELHAGHIDKAGEVAKSLIERDPQNPLYLTLRGNVEAARRDYASAEAAFRAALSRASGFATATRALAELYAMTGRTDDAKRVYGELLAKNPADTTGLAGLADLAVADGKWSEVTGLLNSARAAAHYDPIPGLKLVGVYETRRDWKSAKSVAAELWAQFPRDANVVLALGRTRLQSGDTNGAISAYKLANQLAPGSAPIRAAYVALLKQAKFFRDAWDVLQQAIIQEPQNASLKADLIRVDAEFDGVDGAVSRAREFAASDPGNSIYTVVAAELYEKAGRAAQAIALLEKEVTTKPADAGLTVALAHLYARMGDFAKAEGLLTARLQANPDNLAAASALAPIYLMTGRPDEAKKAYSDVLVRNPNDVAALIGSADLLVAKKQWTEAAGDISRARAAAPDEPGPGLALVNFYVMRQDWKSAIATANELSQKFSGDVDVLDKLGRVMLAGGDAEGATAAFRRAHDLAPNSAPILARYLGVLQAEKNFSAARAVLQAAVDRDAKNPSLKADLIRVEAESDGVDAGLAKARTLSLSDPENAVYDIVSAELYEKAGRRDEAVAVLEKAMAAHPSAGGLAPALSRLYFRAGMPAKAESVLKARLEAEPNDAAARAELAFHYAEQHRETAAISEYSRLVEQDPVNVTSLNNLAWLYQNQGELKKARELAQRAFAIAPRDGHVSGTLGCILLNQGEAGNALAYLNAAELSAPGNPEIEYHLAVALDRVGQGAEARALLERLLSSGRSFTQKTEAEKLLLELKRG